MIKAVNFSRQSQISRNSAPAAKFCIMPRFLLILVFGQGGTDVKAHLVTDELTYLAHWMDMSAFEGLLSTVISCGSGVGSL